MNNMFSSRTDREAASLVSGTLIVMDWLSITLTSIRKTFPVDRSTVSNEPPAMSIDSFVQDDPLGNETLTNMLASDGNFVRRLDFPAQGSVILTPILDSLPE